MKKLFALLITALIIISCEACAPDTNPTDSTTAHTHTHPHTQETTNTTSQQETTNTLTPSAEATESATKTVESEKPTQAESDTPSQNTEKNLYRGTINGNTYKSSTTGLTFTKPADWKYLSDEELALKIGVDTMELADYVFPTTADRVPVVYDMWATDPDNSINICITYENMYVSASVAMTTDEYLEMLEGAFRNTEGTTQLEKSKVKLSGQTYQKAIFQTETGGVSTQTIYYLRGMGKFMNIVLVSSPIGTDLPDIEKMFS